MLLGSQTCFLFLFGVKFKLQKAKNYSRNLRIRNDMDISYIAVSSSLSLSLIDLLWPWEYIPYGGEEVKIIDASQGKIWRQQKIETDIGFSYK